MTQPIKQTHIRVSKTARVYTIGELSAATRTVWLACHGYGQLAVRFAERLQSIATAERVIIVPEGLHRFYLDPIDRSASERRVGATWMTREARADDIADYVEYLDAVTPALSAEQELVGFGFSQGTATITRWAAATERRVHRLVLWGAGLPPDLDWERAETRFKTIPITLVVGKHDPFALPERIAEQETLLREHQVPFQTVHYDGYHRIEPAVLRAISGV